mgnify:FL=1
MKNYLKLIRIKHWLKNGLVVLPLFFGRKILNVDKITSVILAFLIFSMISSIIYVINDINDIENDRNHPTKKDRPLASGKISIKNAILVLILLLILSTSLIIHLYNKTTNIYIILIPIIYIVLNLLYSLKLKQVPIIDVAILVSGFVLRVYYGGVSSNIEISTWLYLMVMFGSFYLGFGKRRNELKQNKENNTRKVLEFYNKEFLDKNMYVSLGLAIISYSLWCVDPLTKTNITSNYLILTIPLIMMIFQKYSLIIEGDSDGDPIEVILNDKTLIFLLLIYIISMFVIVYL